MKSYRLRSALFMLMFYVPLMLYAQDSPSSQLDFTSALSRMMNTNELLQSVLYEKQKSEYNRKASYSLFLPKVDVNFVYTHLSEPIEMDFNPLKDAMIDLSAQAYAGGGGPGGASAFTNAAKSDPRLADSNFIETIQDQDFWTTSVSFKQPVFTGGKILAAYHAAEAASELSSGKVQYTRNALTTELAQRYYSLRLAMKVADLRKDVLEGMKEHMDQAAKMHANGVISTAEKLHAEVAYSEAEREYHKSLRDLDTVRAALKNTLSMNESIEPVSEFFICGNISELDYYKKKAQESNPVLAQIKANQKLARQGYLKEAASYSPDIFLFGSANVANQNLSEYAPEWFIGGGATLTLFDGLGRYNKMKSAEMTEQSVESAMKQAKKDIDALVEKNYNDLMKDTEQIRSLEKSIESAEEYLRVREIAFKEGVGSSMDVVDARLNLSKVKFEKLNALFTYDVSLARLLEVSGISDQYDTYRKESEKVALSVSDVK